MAKRALYLACYDIADDKRLRRALQVLRGYATGGQKSVFECYLNRTERTQLVEAVREVIDPSEDRFLLMRLDARRRVRVLGIGVVPQDPEYFYIG